MYSLIWMIIIAGAGVILYLMTGQLMRLNSKIDSLEMQAQKLTASKSDIINGQDLKETLMYEIESHKSKFYSQDEIDPYQFSRMIDGLLTSNNITIDKYQTVETDDTLLLEYTIQGNAYGLSCFLQHVFHSDKYWNMPFLVVDTRETEGRIRAVFRIRYETIDQSDS